jgi:hypothetical protein
MAPCPRCPHCKTIPFETYCPSYEIHLYHCRRAAMGNTNKLLFALRFCNIDIVCMATCAIGILCVVLRLWLSNIRRWGYWEYGQCHLDELYCHISHVLHTGALSTIAYMSLTFVVGIFTILGQKCYFWSKRELW